MLTRVTPTSQKIGGGDRDHERPEVFQKISRLAGIENERIVGWGANNPGCEKGHLTDNG